MVGMRKRTPIAVTLFIGLLAALHAQQSEPFATFAARNGILRPERYAVGGGEVFYPLITEVDTATRTVRLGGYLPATGTVVFRWDDYREWVAEDGDFTPAHLARRLDASLPIRFVVVSWTGKGGETRSATLYAWLDRPNTPAPAPRRAPLGATARLVVSDLVAQVVTPDPAAVMRTQTLGGRRIEDLLSERFPEVFDFVFLAPRDAVTTLPASGWVARSNDAAGIGLDRFSDPAHPRLRGLVVLSSSGSYTLGWSHLAREMARAWVNYGVVTDRPGAWGFSTAYGKLGGMDGGTVKDLGAGRYSAAYFVPGHNSWVPYSPMELYLMGLAPAAEVPPLRVFDGARVVDETPELITFTATSSRVVTVQDLIAAKGARLPAWPAAPRTFRALTVVVTDTELDNYELSNLERALAAFSLDAPLSYRYDWGELNYNAATRGRATIRLDGLREIVRADTP